MTSPADDLLHLVRAYGAAREASGKAQRSRDIVINTEGRTAKNQGRLDLLAATIATANAEADELYARIADAPKELP